MIDIELQALTGLVESQRLGMEADNLSRANNGFSPAWSSDVDWPERDALQAELKRRGIIKD